MPARPDDDFAAFTGREEMFFGLRDPFGLIRSEVEAALREQIADAEVLAIVTLGEPKFRTLARKVDGDELLEVSQFAFCVRARLTVLFDAGQKGEVLEACLTFLFADTDQRGSERFRRHFDLHAEAEKNFNDEVFRQRFLAFRAEPR